MRRKRTLHKPGFESTVALTAIQGELTMAEMVSKFDVQAPQIAQWKKQLLASAEGAFDKGDQSDMCAYDIPCCDNESIFCAFDEVNGFDFC